jgi:GNAT superfamily N-acetyltransferase
MQEDQSRMSEGLAVQVDGEAGSARVRLYRLGDEGALVEMHRSIFPEESRTLDDWWWCFRQAPEGPADIRVLESEGRVVGAITHVPGAVWIEGRRRRLAIGCDLMIRPEFRGQGGSRQLVNAFLAAEHGFDVNFGQVSAGSSHVMGRYAGTVTLGRVENWVRFRSRGVAQALSDPIDRNGGGAALRRYAQPTASERERGGSRPSLPRRRRPGATVGGLRTLHSCQGFDVPALALVGPAWREVARSCGARG